MPINLQLVPPPAFETSIVPAFSTNFARIRDAFLRAFGGDYQTGTHTQGAVGTAVQHYNIPFPVVFQQTTPPVVVANPVWQGAVQWHQDVVTSDPSFFTIYATTVGGGNSTENLIIRWVAFYP